MIPYFDLVFTLNKTTKSLLLLFLTLPLLLLLFRFLRFLCLLSLLSPLCLGLCLLLRLHNFLIEKLLLVSRIRETCHEQFLGSVDLALQIGGAANLRIVFLEERIVSLHGDEGTSSTSRAQSSYKLLSMLRICSATDSVRGGALRLFCPMTLLKYCPKKELSVLLAPPVVSLQALKTDLKMGRPVLMRRKMRMKFIQFQLSLLCTLTKVSSLFIHLPQLSENKYSTDGLIPLGNRFLQVILMSQKCRAIISKCLEQNQSFRQWDSDKKYSTFHHSHYDWWAFPIDQPSSHGAKYQVDQQDLPAFRNDTAFINALRSNSILVCKSWGYDLVKGCELTVVTADQKWQRWPIRLYKMACSLQLFQQRDLHLNAIKYGWGLIDQGYKFHYMRDLSAYFNQFRTSKDGEKRDERKDQRVARQEEQQKMEKKLESNNQTRKAQRLNPNDNQGQNKYKYSSSVYKPTQYSQKPQLPSKSLIKGRQF